MPKINGVVYIKDSTQQYFFTKITKFITGFIVHDTIWRLYDIPGTAREQRRIVRVDDDPKLTDDLESLRRDVGSLCVCVPLPL